MRRILVQSLTSTDRQDRDCRVTEVMRQDQLVTTIKRRCTYHIESRVPIVSLDDSIQWAQDMDPRPGRQVYMTKQLDPESGNELVTYKVLGHFYVVMDFSIFCIGYRHILSMEVIGTEPPSDE